ncbi:MAG: hypothetical protein HW416_3722, partial [Chloroflexi bacterium]|nr:hypothetical protein [Chloroflexota bacterium]
GTRYYFLPSLALIATLVWMLGRSRPALARLTAGSLLGVSLLLGIPLDWRYDPFTDMRYAQHVARFENAPPGTRVVVPLNPDGWSMTLIRR